MCVFLKTSFHLFVYVYVQCMWVSLCVHIHVCTCLWWPETNTGSLPQSLSTLLFEPEALPVPEAH